MQRYEMPLSMCLLGCLSSDTGRGEPVDLLDRVRGRAYARCVLSLTRYVFVHTKGVFPNARKGDGIPFSR